MNEANLQIRLLGGHAIQHDGKNITLDLPHKGRALLVYLLLTKRVHTRKQIAKLLWPHVDPDKALRSLRVLLNALRNKHHLTPFIKTDRVDIEIDGINEIWCDVLDFRTYTGTKSNNDDFDRNTLQKGIDFYLGKFMLGFDATDTPFDDWLFQQQIALEETAVHGLVDLIEQFDVENNPRAAIEYAYRLVEIDPWREASYRRLMWVLARSDRADAALFAYENCCQILHQELAVLPEQETVLLAEQIRQEKIAVVQVEPSPPLPANSDVPFLAPAVRGPFVGREQVMGRLETVLSEKDGRSRTCLTGMGGIGKTMIALQLAHKLKIHFPDGVLWADAAQQEPLTIVDRWATAYGYDLHHVKNERERLIALRSIFAEKQALIVVDDVSSAAAVRPLLPEDGQCKLLFTSRSEDVARLLDAQSVRVDGLSEANGRSLLSHFVPSKRASQEPQAFADICDLLHHLPLAIVIAGNYLLERQHMRLSDFVGQLETATQKLDIKNANRQVRASFNVSWESLHPEEKEWFRLLGVFNGRHFSTEAFAAVAELDVFAAEAQLQNLVQLSLLNRVENGRFRQHPLLAEFSNEKLPVKDASYMRMINHYCQFAIEQQSNYKRLQPEWENFNASINIAFHQHQWSIVLQLSRVLQPAWFARGRYTDARHAFVDASKAAMYLEDGTAVAEIYFNWGQACLEQSDYQKAKEQLTSSLELYREEDNQIGLGNVNYELSRLAINNDKYDEAENFLAISRNVREKINDVNGVAVILYQQARIYYRQGQYNKAEDFCNNALLVHEQNQNSLGKVHTLRLLVNVMARLGDYKASRRFAEEALMLAKVIDDRGEIGMAYYGLAIACRYHNEIDQALEYADRGLEILKLIGDVHSQALILYQKCLIYKLANEFDLALAVANEALLHFQRLKDQFSEAITIGHMGDCFSALGQQTIGCEKWNAALRIAETLQNKQFTQALKNRLADCA